MTDERIKMNCPFCGESNNEIQIASYGSSAKGARPVAVKLYCSKCQVCFHGKSKQEVIDLWNCRV